MIDKSKLSEIVAKAKADNPNAELHLLTVEDDQVIVRVPSGAAYQFFKDMASDDKKKTRALEELTRSCVVYPDATAFDALLERRPGLGTSFGGKLVELAGVVEEVEAKKL
jgi:hypothetical protein